MKGRANKCVVGIVIPPLHKLAVCFDRPTSHPCTNNHISSLIATTASPLFIAPLAVTPPPITTVVTLPATATGTSIKEVITAVSNSDKFSLLTFSSSTLIAGCECSNTSETITLLNLRFLSPPY